ncbi:hypothetical protein JCM16303_004020 [Sporobolomyces ruberrimus]
MAQEIRSLIIYGSHLFPTKLASILQNVTPLSSSTVVVPAAFLSFDIKGIPFLEPCYANCIVQGYNDHGEWEYSVEKQGEKGHANGEADVRKSEVYKEWVWSRCCTSAEYEGDLPHPLEGMLYELGHEDFHLVLDRLLAASPNAPHSLVPVDCERFVNGDPELTPPPNAPTRGELIVFHSSKSTSPRSIERMQPTQQYLALILRGAFFTGPLTRTYLSHLFLLQPYNPTSSVSKRFMRLLVRLILLPQFVVFWIPSKVIPGLGWWNNVVGERVCRGWGVLNGLERVYERLTGQSGWRN